MSSSPGRGPGLCSTRSLYSTKALGTATTFLAAWNSLAVLVFLGPRLRASAAVLVGIAAAFDVAAAAAVGAGTVWSRRVGSRTALASGSAVFAVASAGCAVVSGSVWVVAARAVQGIAAALMVAAAFEALGGGPGVGSGPGARSGATLVPGSELESGPELDSGSGPRSGPEPGRRIGGGSRTGVGDGLRIGGFRIGGNLRTGSSLRTNDAVRTDGVGAALVCGPLLAGAAASVDGWRWVFWVDAIVGVGIWCAVLARGARMALLKADPPPGPEPESETGRSGRDRAPAVPSRPPRSLFDLFDLFGLALVTVAVAGPVGALDEAASAGWSNIRTLALLAAGLLALAPILVWQTPLGALYGRAFVASQVADLCLFAATAGTLFLLAQYFHVVAGSGPLSVGLRIAPWSAAVAVVLPVSASAELGARSMRRLIVAGLALDAIGLLGLASAVRGRQTGWWLAPALVVSGAGVGLALPAARRAAVTVAGLRRSEGVVGGLGAVRWAGAGLGVALLGAVLAARGGLGTSPAGHGAASAGAAAALVAAAGAAAALTLPARDRPPVAPVFTRPEAGGGGAGGAGGVGGVGGVGGAGGTGGAGDAGGSGWRR